MRVSPFGYLRIDGYVLLPAAFRSLSRPSSAPDAKAFSVCSFSLELPFEQVSLFSGSRLAFRLNCCVHTCSFFGKIVFFYPLRKNLISFEDFRLCRPPSSVISCFPYFVCHVCHMHSFEFMFPLIRFSMNIRPCWAS